MARSIEAQSNLPTCRRSCERACGAALQRLASSQGARWDEIYALYRLNSVPFNATGEVIKNDGVWKVYEFTWWQMDAILLWARFEGRWLRSTEFHYPEQPENLPALKPLENWRNPIREICGSYKVIGSVEPLSH